MYMVQTKKLEIILAKSQLQSPMTLLTGPQDRGHRHGHDTMGRRFAGIAASRIFYVRLGVAYMTGLKCHGTAMAIHWLGAKHMFLLMLYEKWLGVCEDLLTMFT